MPDQIKKSPLDNAWSFAKSGNYQKAIRSLLDSDQVNSNSYTLASLSYFYYMIHDYESAHLHAHAALELYPKTRMALTTLGDLSIKQNDYESAERFFTEAVRYHPESEYPAIRLADVYQYSGNYILAVDLLEKILINNPDSRQILDRLGLACLSAGNHERGEQVRRLIKELDKHSNGLDIKRLIASIDSLPPESAKLQLEKLARMPSLKNSTEIQNKLALSHIQNREFHKAIPILEVLLEKKPRSEGVRLKLINCLTRAGNPERAAHLLGEAKYLASSIAYQIAEIEILAASGNGQDAIDNVFRLLLIEPRNKRIRQLLKLLKSKGFRPTRGILEGES